MSWVVDASVALKWFVREADSDLALGLRRGSRELVAPELIIGETCNAGWKAFRRGELSVDQCLLMTTGIINAFGRFAGHAALAHKAMQLSVTIDHPVYDCLYLALAEQEGTSVITADGRLLRKLRATPYETLVRDLATFA